MISLKKKQKKPLIDGELDGSSRPYCSSAHVNTSIVVVYKLISKIDGRESSNCGVICGIYNECFLSLDFNRVYRVFG